MKPDYLHVIWAVNDCPRSFSLLGSCFFFAFFFFSLTSSQNYRQEIESRIGARGCVCFVAKGVLWRQQVGLWIPSPARRHEAHAQEASPAKYSWPPSPPIPSPPSIYRSAHCEPSREQTVKVASFSSPLLICHPSTAVSFNELSVFFFSRALCFEIYISFCKTSVTVIWPRSSMLAQTHSSTLDPPPLPVKKKKKKETRNGLWCQKTGLFTTSFFFHGLPSLLQPFFARSDPERGG